MAAFHVRRPCLRDGEHEYLLLELHELLPQEHEPVALGDTWRTERRLRELAHDYFNLRTLRSCSTCMPSRGGSSLPPRIRR